MLQKFNHEKENIHEALCLSDDVKNVVREKIFFSTFSTALAAEELFDSIDDAPSQLTTVTGILEKVIGLVSDTEYDYMLLTFYNWHDLARHAYKHYKMINDTNVSSEIKTKMKILELLQGLKDDSDSSEEKKSGELNPKDVLKRINLTKKSGYNFDKYMYMVSELNLNNISE
jgi:hypothetical protein